VAVTGLFGSTFDPPHNGHLALVEAAVDTLALDRLVILVAARPRYKAVETPLEDRLALARAAFPSCEVEVEESTTDETMREAAGRYGDVIFLIGADQFRDFPTWNDPEAVLELGRLGVGTRPGVPREELDAVLAQLARPERVVFFEIPVLPIASRELRAKVAAGEPIRGLVPDAVVDEIEARGLYHP
jgi:nicotinate-nucleotide adenylyltransferase